MRINSYTMNQTSLLCGVESVREQEYFEENLRKLKETREWTKQQLTELGFTYTGADANFIFVTHPVYDAKQLFEALKKEEIYVRFWGSERIEQYLRITSGTQDEMEVLVSFLKNYIKKG